LFSRILLFFTHFRKKNHCLIFCKKVVKKVEKVLKNWSKRCQKVVKSCQSSQKLVKKLSKSCQKVVKNVSNIRPNFCYIGKGWGEEEESEEDWWLQDQAATSSHLVKIPSAHKVYGIQFVNVK
jgi:hypothetical protein